MSKNNSESLKDGLLENQWNYKIRCIELKRAGTIIIAYRDCNTMSRNL